MVERGRGAVIFVASTAAYQATPFFSVYSATKVFNLFMGEGLWLEYRKLGIDAMALSPGYTKTEFQKAAGLNENVGGFLWETPDNVVDTALENLGKKPSVIHGSLNRFLAFTIRLFPRKWVIVVAGMISKSQP